MGKLGETIAERLKDGDVSQRDAADIFAQLRPMGDHIAKRA